MELPESLEYMSRPLVNQYPLEVSTFRQAIYGSNDESHKQESTTQVNQVKNYDFNRYQDKELYNSRIEKLMKENKNFEQTINQNQRLINRDSVTDYASNTILRDKITYLERCNGDLHDQKLLLSKEINELNFERSKLEIEHQNIRTEGNELRLQLTVKNQCITELKRKIQQQQSELQHISQNNTNLIHSLDSAFNELQCVKKSENWYKQEFHQFQIDKSNFNKTKLENEKSFLEQQKKIERLKLEINHLKRIFEDIKKGQEEKLANLDRHVSQLQTELRRRNEEKSSVENSLKNITEQFKILKLNHRFLNNELNKFKQDADHRDLENDIGVLETNNEVISETIDEGVTQQQRKDKVKHEKSNMLSNIQEHNNLLLEEKPNSFKWSGLTANEARHKLNIIEICNILIFIYNWCKINHDINHNHTSGDCSFKSNNSVTLFNQIIKYQENLAVNAKHIHHLKKNLSRLKKQAMNRLKTLQIKCELLQRRSDKNDDMLKGITELQLDNNKLREDVKNLRAALQVKDREANEKQLRYERHCHILIRKAAEQRRVRKQVENKLLEMQEINSHLIENDNSNKLKLDLINADLIRLRKQLAASGTEKEHKHISESNLNGINELVEENPCLNVIDSVNYEMDDTRTQNSSHKKQESHGQNVIIEDSSVFQLSPEEPKDVLLQEQNKWLQKESNLKNLISSLNSQLDFFKSKINAMSSEKFFLQRLCSDLKAASNLHINQNKALKIFINNMCGKKDQTDIGDFFFPSPKKFDDSYINKLLDENRTSLDKYSSENEEYFNVLSKKVILLQQQIREKFIL